MHSFKKFWPIIFIIGVWFIFSAPFFISGKVPFPSTYLSNFFSPWSAYGTYIGPIKNAATPDVATQIYPWKNLVIEIWKSGNIPLWNSYGFSGTPLLANYQSAVFSPLNLLYFVFSFINAWSIQILLQPLLAGIFMYIFAKSLRFGESASLISSLAFMFCGFITTWMVYGTLGYAIIFLPLALFAIEKFYQTKKWFYTLLLSLTFPLSFFSGHFQISLYFLVFVLGYSVFKFIQMKDFRMLALNIISICLGIFISLPQLLPSIELYAQSLRSGLFMKAEVIPWGYIPTFLAPDFLGNPVTRNDWFGHYAEWNGYIGLIPFILGFYSFRKRNHYINFFLFASIVTIFFAFQTPLLDLLVNLKIPVLSTSAAGRIIVLFSFSFAVLAGFGFENLINDLKNKNFKPMSIWILFFVLIFISLWGVILFKLFIPFEKILIALSNLKLPTIIFSLFLIPIFIVRLFPNKKTIIFLSTFFILVIAFDVLRFTTKWQPFDPKNLVFQEVPVSKFLEPKVGYSRVLGNFGAEAAITFKMPIIEGYDALYIKRYGDFIASSLNGSFLEPSRSVVSFPRDGKFGQKVLNLLGVKFLVHKVSDGRFGWTYPFWNFLDTYKLIYKDPAYQVYENKDAYDRAFLVSKYRIESDSKILSSMFDNKTNLKEEVLLEETPNFQIAKNSSGSTVIKKYSSNRIDLETNSIGNSVLVLTDPFYNGWKAYVDEREEKIYRADYTFRAIYIPSGKHVVSFIYDPDSFRIGIAAAIIGILGVVIESIYLKKK